MRFFFGELQPSLVEALLLLVCTQSIPMLRNAYAQERPIPIPQLEGHFVMHDFVNLEEGKEELH